MIHCEAQPFKLAKENASDAAEPIPRPARTTQGTESDLGQEEEAIETLAVDSVPAAHSL